MSTESRKILDERLAKGEIDIDEYEKLRSVLDSGSNGNENPPPLHEPSSSSPDPIFNRGDIVVTADSVVLPSGRVPLSLIQSVGTTNLSKIPFTEISYTRLHGLIWTVLCIGLLFVEPILGIALWFAPLVNSFVNIRYVLEMRGTENRLWTAEHRKKDIIEGAAGAIDQALNNSRL